MLAAVKTGPGKAELREVERPRPSKDEVLLRITACAICASDFPGWNADQPQPPRPGTWSTGNPGVTGHEIAGKIIEVGRAVDASRLDERVWVDAINGCGRCHACHSGCQNLCLDATVVSQGFAEYVTAPARQCRRIPLGMTDVDGSLIFDMAGTPMGAAYRAAIQFGDTVAVWGLGPVGVGLVQAARIAGAQVIVGVDPVYSRRMRAEQVGATTTCDPLSEDAVMRMRELTHGRGADVVLSSTSSGEASGQAFAALRLEGRMVTVAGFPPAGGQEPKWVSGNWGCHDRDWPKILDHIVSREFDLAGYVTHTFALAQLDEAFDVRMNDPEESFKVVVVP
jgi:threonine dehydrogenase-like Zn-dependent dehydrogenase